MTRVALCSEAKNEQNCFDKKLLYMSINGKNLAV